MVYIIERLAIDIDLNALYTLFMRRTERKMHQIRSGSPRGVSYAQRAA